MHIIRENPFILVSLLIGLALLMLSIVFTHTALFIWACMFLLLSGFSLALQYYLGKPQTVEQEDFSLLDTFK